MHSLTNHQCLINTCHFQSITDNYRWLNHWWRAGARGVADIATVDSNLGSVHFKVSHTHCLTPPSVVPVRMRTVPLTTERRVWATSTTAGNKTGIKRSSSGIRARRPTQPRQTFTGTTEGRRAGGERRQAGVDWPEACLSVHPQTVRQSGMMPLSNGV